MSFVAAVFLLIVSVVDAPQKDIVEDRFDLIEVNIFHSEWGVPRFAQLIVYDWEPREKAWKVQAWKLMRDAFDKTDEEHRIKWEEEADKIVESYSLPKRLEARSEFSRYPGKFVGGKLMPRKDYSSGDYNIVFFDNHVLRRIIAPSYRFTKTQYDPETVNKKTFPEDTRRGLRNENEMESSEGFPEEALSSFFGESN